MSGLLAEQHDFYRRRVPEQFDRTFETQRRLAARSDDARERGLFEEMRAVRTLICVRVRDGEQVHDHRLLIDEGHMRIADGCDRPAFLTLTHELEAFPRIRAQCGDSILGFLGALAGLGDEMKLTARRVRSLREIGGSVLLEMRGERGFELRAHFGAGEPETRPRTAIRLDEEVFERLRRGALDPQSAFLGGEVEVEGSMKMAIKLALAALSPD